MSNTEEKIYPLLCEKRNLKEKAKERSNINSMTYKKPNHNVNGFINIIFASIISILIAVIIIMIIK